MSPGSKSFRLVRLRLLQTEGYFLRAYRGESLAVKANLRVLLSILFLVLLALLLTAPQVLWTPSSEVSRALVILLLLFVPAMLWLLKKGFRHLVTFLFSVVLSAAVLLPYLLNAVAHPDGDPLAPLSFQIFVQLVLISAATEKSRYLVFGFVIALGTLVVQTFVFQWPPESAAQSALLLLFARFVVDIALATGVLAILQRALHQAIVRVEASNQVLEKTVIERTAQLRQTQQALVEGEHLAVLGRLAAGVAHEINTPLGAIQSSNSTIRTLLPEVLARAVSLFQRLTAPQEEALIDILDRCAATASVEGLPRRQRIETFEGVLRGWGTDEARPLATLLVDTGLEEVRAEWRDLMTGPEATEVFRFVADFAALQRAGLIVDSATQKAAHYVVALRQSVAAQSAKLTNEWISVEEGLDAVLLLLGSQIGPGIRLFKSLEPGLRIQGQAARLMQAWSQLIVNAAQAMSGQGTLTILSRKAGTDVEILFADSGREIYETPPENWFDGHLGQGGSGPRSGLMTVRTIIEEHAGQVAFSSEVGKFQVHIRLPLAPKQE